MELTKMTRLNWMAVVSLLIFAFYHHGSSGSAPNQKKRKRNFSSPPAGSTTSRLGHVENHLKRQTGEKLAEDQRRKSDEVAAASYTPDTIDQPLDVLFMVDRSSPLDADLIGSKCLLRNLTDHFQVAYYKKIRIALMNVDGDPGLEFNFRKYHDQYGYQRGYEVLVGEDGVENYVGRALTYASRTLLMPISNLAARQNVPKVIVAILGSESRDAVQAGAQEMLGEPYRVTVAVGYGNASVTDLQEITGGDVESVLFAQNAQEMCQMWTQVHRVIVDRLNDLYSAPLNAPGGFTIGLYNQDVAEIGWQRPDNLVTSYSIRYGPSQMDNNTPTIEMVVDVRNVVSTFIVWIQRRTMWRWWRTVLTKRRPQVDLYLICPVHTWSWMQL